MIDVMENIKKLSAALDAETASLHPSGKLLLLGSQDSVFLKAIKRKADQLGINCDHTSNPLPPYRGIVVDSETVSFNSSVNRAIDRICDAYIEDETVLADQEGRDPVLIRHFSAHNLRHTFCTRFCENERNIKVIQEIMGHADIETTMNIYAEATKEKKKESFSNLEGKIKIS